MNFGWVGWLYLDGLWHRACEADSLGKCAVELGRIGEEKGVPTWCQCMTTGGVPSWVPNGK